MNATEGLTRIAKLISILGWVVAGFGLLVSFSTLWLGQKPDWMVLLIGSGFALIAWAFFQGIVWIIDGFIGNDRSKSSIIWPRNLRRKKQPQLKLQPTGPDLVGVRGWLFFFVIVLIVLSPLRTLGEVASLLRETERVVPQLLGLQGWRLYKNATWLLALVTAGSFAFAGYSLLTHHHRSSVAITYIALWVIPALTLLADFWASAYYLNIRQEDFVNRDLIAGLGQSLFFATVWTAYLKLSRRVKNTYYSTPESAVVSRPARSEPSM